MTRERTTKQLAGRIEPTYHRRVHPLRRLRFLLSIAICSVALLWVALAGDSIHANGQLAAAHATFEKNCAECHRGNFEPIADESCRACHDAGSHVSGPRGEATATEPACASCHRDHRGRTGLARVADGHCDACHKEHRDIRDFAGHIEFATDAVDQHVRFNHERHLDPKLQEGPLVCVDCHVARKGGFESIRFDSHCARCHVERVDDEFPDETVPHGFQAKELRDWVGAIYLRRLGAGDHAQRIERATRGLFDPQRKHGCLLCHEWKDGLIVAPVIPDHWHTAARFDHRPHGTLNCAHCHEMKTSKLASDLRLPGIATCRECHTPKAVPAHCVTCHPYHAK